MLLYKGTTYVTLAFYCLLRLCCVHTQYGRFLFYPKGGDSDVLIPVITSGTYEILRNYYKMGDCYVQLEYSNGETITAQRVFRDNTNTAYLTFNRDNLSYDLKK